MFGFCFRSLVAGVSLVAGIPAAWGATSSSYYQIDFSGPSSIPPDGFPFAPGNPGAFSGTNFGHVAHGTFPGTGSGAAVFNTTGNNTGTGFYYDQTQLNFYQTGRFHRLSADLHITGLLGTKNKFTIIFDNPGSHRVDFNPDGTFMDLPAGYFEEDKPIHIDLVGDTVTNLLTVTINGIVLPLFPYYAEDGLLRTIRMNLGSDMLGDPNDGRTTVYVDNVTASVPEPTLSLFGLMGSLLLLARRRPSRVAASA